MKKLLLTTAILAATSVPSFAGSLDSDYQYFTAKVVSSNYDIDGVDVDRAAGFNLTVGRHLTDSNVSVEAGYSDLGESTARAFGLSADVSATTLFANAKFDYKIKDNFSAYTKLGLNRVSLEVSSGSFSETESEMKLMYGAGAQFTLTPEVSLVTDYVVYAADISALSMGVAIQF